MYTDVIIYLLDHCKFWLQTMHSYTTRPVYNYATYVYTHKIIVLRYNLYVHYNNVPKKQLYQSFTQIIENKMQDFVAYIFFFVKNNKLYKFI